MPNFRNQFAIELKNRCIDNSIESINNEGSSSESDVDFEQHMSDSKNKGNSKKARLPLKDLSNIDSFGSSNPKNWEDVNVSLRSLLPNEDGITYVVTTFDVLSREKFSGAPANAFKTIVRINLNTADDAKKWLESMMKHSNCTYRHSKGRVAGLKRVCYKVEMHCQHKKKPLTPYQKQQKAKARVKNPRKVLVHDLRQKKTECPSVLKLTVSIPTKKYQLASLDYPYLVSHPAILDATFNHNHPIQSAHALSFRPIDSQTKESFFALFRKGHSASSAYHWYETKLFLDGGEDQLLLADRATNPTKSDVSRLYEQWRKTELGADNGKALFDQLHMEICSYNEANSGSGGQAKLQCYENEVSTLENTDSESDVDEKPPQKKKKVLRSQPMIIAICTPLMCRVHRNIQQAGEMLFCDATSSLDRFNTSMFILSTSNAAGGLPLGVLITSDEQQDTICQGLQLLKDVFPDDCFYGRGFSKGPPIFMTDDSAAERNAIRTVWPNSQLLLCAFHFLQSNWTWLHDGSNQVNNADRKVLISAIKSLVYAENENQLISRYEAFTGSEIAKKYPKYLSHIQGHWSRRREWAICFRKNILVRGNHTNNYSEAGMRILKELVFSRVKAYNHVQMFSFITDCFELYYTRKLLSVAHNRMDRYISLKYQGIKCINIAYENIVQLDSDEATYLVDSQTDRGVKYLVNMELGVCSCNAGRDGSPCSHQAAVVKHYHIPSVNCIPVLSPESRKLLATIALGSSSIQSPPFYSSLHEKSLSASHSEDSQSKFDGSSWELMKGLASLDSEEEGTQVDNSAVQSDGVDYDKLVKDVDEVFADLRERVKENVVVAQGTQTFVKRYKEMTTRGKFTNAVLGSALHKFGWVFGGQIKSTHGGYLRRGRRIPISAKSAGRRRGNLSRGKAKVPSGRPKGAKIAYYPPKYSMQPRRVPKGKRLHSLKKNINRGIQNAGKW